MRTFPGKRRGSGHVPHRMHGLGLNCKWFRVRRPSKRNVRINKKWHARNRMPKNPGLEERIKWHLEHLKNCACRPVPQRLLIVINKRSK